MAATLETPTDDLSGLPLAIAPKCEWLPTDEPNVADLHHGNHPRYDPRLRTLAGRALRNCWLQIVERDLHNEGPFSYHQFYAGPWLPDCESEVFSRIVPACAGYIPDEVIDLVSGEPFRRPATPEETEFLHTPSADNKYGYRYITYRYEPIRAFLRHYVVQQRIGEEHIRERFIDEFLHTGDERRKLYLGHLLLVKAAEAAAEPVNATYKALKRAGMLHPLMPHDPQDLVKYKLGSPEQRSLLIPTLETRVRQYYMPDTIPA